MKSNGCAQYAVSHDEMVGHFIYSRRTVKPTPSSSPVESINRGFYNHHHHYYYYYYYNDDDDDINDSR